MKIKNLVRRIKDGLAEARGEYFSTNKWVFLAPITIALTIGTLYQSIRVYGFADGMPYIVMQFCVILLMIAEINYSDLPSRNLALTITLFAFLTTATMAGNFGYLTWMSRQLRAIEHAETLYAKYKVEDDAAIAAQEQRANERAGINAQIAKAATLQAEARERETRRIQGIVNTLAMKGDVGAAVRIAKTGLAKQSKDSLTSSLLSSEDDAPIA